MGVSAQRTRDMTGHWKTLRIALVLALALALMGVSDCGPDDSSYVGNSDDLPEDFDSGDGAKHSLSVRAARAVTRS